MSCTYEYRNGAWGLVSDDCKNTCPNSPNDPPPSPEEGDRCVEPCPIIDGKAKTKGKGKRRRRRIANVLKTTIGNFIVTLRNKTLVLRKKKKPK